MLGPYAKRLVALAIASTLVGLGGAVALSADEAADRAAIEGLWDSYEQASVAGDTETWLSLWDAGGVQMPPGVPARSIEAVADGLAEKWAKRPPRKSMNINPIDIEVAGGWAFARGDYDVTFVAGGGEKTLEGKFLTILKRQEDGSFKIYRDCFNMNVN